MLKLLIAVDGSDPARRAIDFAGRLARETGGVEAVLLNVREGTFGPAELPAFDIEPMERAQAERQRALLDAALTHARAAGLTAVSTLGAVGVPAHEIVRAATETGASQVVMGTRGMGALGSLLVGSVAQRVVHQSAVPVLLVK